MGRHPTNQLVPLTPLISLLVVVVELPGKWLVSWLRGICASLIVGRGLRHPLADIMIVLHGVLTSAALGRSVCRMVL